MAFRFVEDDELKTIELGDGDWVKIPSRLSYGFVSKFNESGVKSDEMSKITDLLVQVIKEWNLKTRDGAVAPISKEFLVRLDVDTIKTLVTEITSLMGVEKKDLAS